MGLAFSGSNFLFSSLKSPGVDDERKRHNKAIEQLQAAHMACTKSGQSTWIRSTRSSAVKAFRDDEAMRFYLEVTGKKVSFNDLGPEPQLYDFYIPSDSQKAREIAFILTEMAATGLVAYKHAK